MNTQSRIEELEAAREALVYNYLEAHEQGSPQAAEQALTHWDETKGLELAQLKEQA